MHLAATPAWFADHTALFVIGAVAALTVLVIWVVERTTARIVCIGVGLILALFVYVNRSPLQACARTCECRVAGHDLTMPACDPAEGR